MQVSDAVLSGCGKAGTDFIFERHHELDGVETVETEVCHEVRGGRDLRDGRRDGAGHEAGHGVSTRLPVDRGPVPELRAAGCGSLRPTRPDPYQSKQCSRPSIV